MQLLTIFPAKMLLQNNLLIILLLPSLRIPWTVSLSDESMSDRYTRKEVEQRPWTDRELMLNGDRVPFHFMELTHRDFQINCDGQCFYHSGQEVNSTCKHEGEKNCGLIASIARHGNQQCGNTGSAIGTALNHTICSPGQFYTISLIRRNLYPSCKTPWDFEKKMPCIPREFVAIAFHDGSDSELNDQDTWYVCVAGESIVTTWKNVKTEAVQIKQTKPYPSSVSGLIASEILLSPQHNSFACRIIISTDKGNITGNVDVKFPTDDEPTGSLIYVKMAQGRVKRNIIPMDDIPDSVIKEHSTFYRTDYNDKDEETLAKEKQYYQKQQALIAPIFATATSPEETEYIFANDFLGPSKTIDFSKLQVTNIPLENVPSDADDKETRKAITKQLRRCDAPRKNGRFFQCFAPNNQRNCIFRQECPVMLIVEEARGSTGLTKLQFRLIGFLQEAETVKKVVRPYGWAAVGFSQDELMGNDLVVACQMLGHDKRVVVAWNGRHANDYIPDVNQGLIDSGATIMNIGSKRNDLFICDWTMNSEFEVDVASYPAFRKKDDEKADDAKTVKLDLKNETYLLIASGSRVYPDFRMGYHTFRQTLREKLIVRSASNKHGPGHLISVFFFLSLAFQ